MKMNDELRKIAESFTEFQNYGGATDDEGCTYAGGK